MPDGGEIIVECVVRGRVRHIVGLRGHRNARPLDALSTEVDVLEPGARRHGIGSGSGDAPEAIRRVLGLVGGGHRLAAPDG